MGAILGGDRDLDGLGDGDAQCKRRMAVDQHCEAVKRVEGLEALDYRAAVFLFIGAGVDGMRRHLTDKRDLALKIIGVGGA